MSGRKTFSLAVVFYTLLVVGSFSFFGYGVAKGFKNAELSRQVAAELCAENSECCGRPMTAACKNTLADEIARRQK